MKDVEVEVKVDLNLKRLLAQEDLNEDLKITIEDRGPKLFFLEDLQGNLYEVSGSYSLSNLLQTLAYAHQANLKVTKIKTSDLFLNPVDRISGEIKERYWDALTRTLDEKGIIDLLEDPKTKEEAKRIYVPYRDEKTYSYFEGVADRHPYLHLEVLRLPEKIELEDYETLDKKPGILALKIDQETQKGVPFVVPGGRFNEMYGWDSYFILLGLLQDDRVDLALSIIENMVYEIEHYGAILNANRTYYLSRSQPPLLTSMIVEVLRYLPEDSSTKEWVKGTLNAAIEEYISVWSNAHRLTPNGLNRYYGLKLKEPPEVEKGHFNPIYSKQAKKAGLGEKEFKKRYLSGDLEDKELDRYFVHDRAMRESGHDTTNRFVNKCADYNTVDLNSLLFKVEEDIASLIRLFFKDAFLDAKGEMHSSEAWHQRAQKRKKLMIQMMWDEKKGLFFDYNFKEKKRANFESATTFYPFFAGLLSNELADALIKKALPLFETPGGLVSTTKESRGRVHDDRPQRQWDYPFGWAPHQMLFWKGLSDYGYKSIARRLAYRWLYMVTKEGRDYNGLLAEKYDVIKRTHKMETEYGNVGVDFGLYPDGGFGWLNASYQVGLSYLSAEEKAALKQLTPPEWLFNV